MNFPAEIWILWIGSALFQASVIVEISRRRLQGSFRFFQFLLIYFLCIMFLSVSARTVTRSDGAYSILFLANCYLSTVFEFLAIQELSRQALGRFPAIRAASTRTLLGLWGGIMVLVAIWFTYLNAVPADKSPLLVAAIRYQDSVSVGFTIYILLFLAFLTWMPVPMTKALLHHAFLLSCYFISSSLAHFVAQDGDYRSQHLLASFIQSGGTAVVCLLWLLRIRTEGQDETFNTPRGPLNSAEAERLFARLEELNTVLSRVGKR
jgi:hypothetical protein